MLVRDDSDTRCPNLYIIEHENSGGNNGISIKEYKSSLNLIYCESMNLASQWKHFLIGHLAALIII